MALVSIVIPVYNAGKTLSRCLDSILSQQFENLEVIIIDALSVDDSVIIARNYNDPRIRILSGKDDGIYDAMNKGVEKASGEWLIFFGADDLFYDDSVLRSVAGKLTDSKAQFIYGNVKISGDTAWASAGDIYDGMFTTRKLFHKNICHQAIFYRKELFERLGNYNTSYKVSADWDFNHRCYASASVEYIDQIIAIFYAGGESTRSNNDTFTSQDIVENLRKYHGINYFNSLYRPFHWAFFNLAHKYLVSRKYFKSCYYLFFSVWHSGRIKLIKNYLVSAIRLKKTATLIHD